MTTCNKLCRECRGEETLLTAPAPCSSLGANLHDQPSHKTRKSQKCQDASSATWGYEAASRKPRGSKAEHQKHQTNQYAMTATRCREKRATWLKTFAKLQAIRPQVLVAAQEQATSGEILLWMTPSEAPKALQASECSELLDPTRANCWISAQHQPGKFTKVWHRHEVPDCEVNDLDHLWIHTLRKQVPQATVPHNTFANLGTGPRRS